MGLDGRREAMRAPRFLRLAQIDEQHFITGCRHGLVHLTWGRSTIRFRRDEFRRLAGLLALDRSLGSAMAQDGRMRITFRQDDDCELQVGALVLLLNSDEFQDLLQAAQEAVQRLDKFLASGAWDDPEPDDALPDASEPFQQFPFSHN